MTKEHEETWKEIMQSIRAGHAKINVGTKKRIECLLAIDKKLKIK